MADPSGAPRGRSRRRGGGGALSSGQLLLHVALLLLLSISSRSIFVQANEASVQADGNVDLDLPDASEAAAPPGVVSSAAPEVSAELRQEGIVPLSSSSRGKEEAEGGAVLAAASKAEAAEEAAEEKVSKALGHSVDDGSRQEDSAAVYHWPIIIGVGVVIGICVLAVALSWALSKLNKSWRAPESRGAVGKAKTLTPGMGVDTRPSFTSP